MLDSVRMRLTLWCVGVLALVLISFSIGVYALLAHSLYERSDAGLRSSVEATAATLEREISKGSSQSVTSELEEQFFPDQSVAVFDAAGRLIAEKPARGNIHAQLPPIGSIPAEIHIYTANDGDEAEDGRRIAVQRINIASAGAPFYIVASQPLEAMMEELEALRNIFYAAVPFALVFAGLGGWFLARRSLAPMVSMSERARRISAENLEQRLPVVNPRDELGKLAETFNELLTRLNASFAQQRQFMADASHELRTPLSVMHTAAAVTLEKPHRAEDEYREALSMVDEQTRRLTRIVEDMFTLARADAGSRTLHCSDFYLDELVGETGRAASLLATRKGVQLTVEGSPESPYRGDEGLLRQMLLNLLGNAVKHTPAGGVVRVSLARRTVEYIITVSDTGSGIPVEAQPHIFERFFRADKARSRADSADGGGAGAGLGLAIARGIAEAHDGRLELAHSDERGSTFIATLPVEHTC